MGFRDDLIVYELMPIDWWDGWIDLTRFLVELFGAEEDYSPDAEPISSPMRFKKIVEAFFAEAKELALEIGWEGDVRQGPFLSALPTGDGSDSLLMLGWKQENNGTSFFATRVAMPHLDRQFCRSIRRIDGKVSIKD